MSHDFIEGMLREAFGPTLQHWCIVGQPVQQSLSGAYLIHLECTTQGPGAHEAPFLTRLVLKRMIPDHASTLPLDATIEQQVVARNKDRSYANEYAFFATHAAALIAVGCRVPRVVRTTDDTCFNVLMEAMLPEDGWQQLPVIPAGPCTRVALRWLARFHAAFLPAKCGGGGRALHTPGAWDAGMHLQLGKRPPTEVERVSSIVAALGGPFANTDPFFQLDTLHSFGEALQTMAPKAATRLAPFF